MLNISLYRVAHSVFGQLGLQSERFQRVRFIVVARAGFIAEQFKDEIGEARAVPAFYEAGRYARLRQFLALDGAIRDDEDGKRIGYARIRAQERGDFVSVEGPQAFFEHDERRFMVDRLRNHVDGRLNENDPMPQPFNRGQNRFETRRVFTANDNLGQYSSPKTRTKLKYHDRHLRPPNYTRSARWLDFILRRGINLSHRESYDARYDTRTLPQSAKRRGNNLNFRFQTFLVALLSMLMTAAVSVRAQDEEDAIQEEAATPEETTEARLDGDVIHLKSGKILSGVQIMRSTPHFYEVRLVEGVPPLQIPRNQVESVEMDDFDPVRDRLRRELFPEVEVVSLASGEKVTRDLMDKLEGPVSAEALSYQRKDFVAILKDIAADLDVKLRIHPSVQAIQPNRRRWKLETTPETTFMSVLRDDLVSQFDSIEVVFDNDTVSIMTKVAAKKLRASRDAEEK